MKQISSIFIIALIMYSVTLKAQSETDKTPKLRVTTGAGYFNDEGMLNGNVLFSEIGYKLNNNYTISLQGYMAEALNNKRTIDDNAYEFLYTYKILNLLFGYELITKNQKHSFEPMTGPFISTNRIVYPLENNNKLIIEEKKFTDIGFAIAIRYQYNFNKNISFGLQGTANIGFNYGYLYGTLTPVFTITH